MSLPANAGDGGDMGRSLGWEDSLDGNPPQYSCLENPLDRAAWQAIVHNFANSQTRLSD